MLYKESERHEILHFDVRTMKTILEYLEASAANYPDKTAVIDEHGSMTYRQWMDAALKIGSALCVFEESGEGRPIPVLMEKGIPALQTFFGIVYAGSFYVLLNPELPQARLKEIVRILDTDLLITDEEHRGLAKELGSGRILLLEELLKKDPADETTERMLSGWDILGKIRESAVDTAPLYANFTSGSTGTPKGVLVGHRSVIDFIDVFIKQFGIDETDVIGNQAPFDFDVSVKDIYSAVSVSATLVVIPKRLFSRPAELLDFICEHKITTMIWAVSALCLITAFHGLDYRVPDTAKRILFSGEVMPQKHLDIWMKHLPKTVFVNLYGPTEITCNCTYHEIDRERDYAGKLPIGKAFSNESVFLLDEQNHLVSEPKKVGEICVGGTTLAIGYYRNEAQTEEHFVQNPLNNRFYERIYKSGDLGYYNEQGELYFCGRRDFQIKHMGHRIELEEIEAMLMKQEGVTRVCCVFDEKKSRLHAAYMGDAQEKELFEKISAQLPVFMIPRKLVRMEALPISKNGKIDRKEVLRVLTEKKYGKKGE